MLPLLKVLFKKTPTILVIVGFVLLAIPPLNVWDRGLPAETLWQEDNEHYKNLFMVGSAFVIVGFTFMFMLGGGGASQQQQYYYQPVPQQQPPQMPQQ